MHLEFIKLTQVNPSDIVELNNHSAVLRQMPLGSPDFTIEKSQAWAKEKDAQWDISGCFSTNLRSLMVYNFH
jgi:hypothetical protein